MSMRNLFLSDPDGYHGCHEWIQGGRDMGLNMSKAGLLFTFQLVMNAVGLGQQTSPVGGLKFVNLQSNDAFLNLQYLGPRDCKLGDTFLGRIVLARRRTWSTSQRSRRGLWKGWINEVGVMDVTKAWSPKSVNVSTYTRQA